MNSTTSVEAPGTFDATANSGQRPIRERRATARLDLALSVRTKGLILFCTLIVYSVLIAWFAFHQKGLLLRDFEAIQSALETEAMLKQVDASTFHAIAAISANIDSSDREAGMRRIQMHHQLFLSRQAILVHQFPKGSPNASHLIAAFEAANKNPSTVNLKLLTAELIEWEADLTRLIERVQENRKTLSERYRQRADSSAMTVFWLGAMGLGLLGAVIGLFFRRLAIDLRSLRNKALETVNGVRGQPILITRRDEVGHLTTAINSMAHTLDRHEKDLMLERQKYFHQEKMAAIGTLAAGITHEIGNPIAAISGIAQEMVERRAAGPSSCTSETCMGCQPELIYAQTLRLAAITREISDFASPRVVEPQLLDLNAQLRSTASLIRYDKRLQHITLRFELDSQLPAIHGVADQLTQVIMNLLINAVDALEGVQGRTPTITIATSADAHRAWMVIADNGCGMGSGVLNRVFEAFFTTKPAGKGTGLGLSLCYSIAKTHGATIEIDSTPGVGTRVHVYFPLNNSLHSEACAL
ncbi:sensor histidine kinase [Rhodoferax sp.]|uniref:sensor histidine kinase n=1 Tax=Rhodoferax sp. TaxID=50421 RepID=UPI002770A78A|nr:ATP-binding protein [Rhodoferax sp.]